MAAALPMYWRRAHVASSSVRIPRKEMIAEIVCQRGVQSSECLEESFATHLYQGRAGFCDKMFDKFARLVRG